MKRSFLVKIVRVILAVYFGVLLMLVMLERFLVYPAPPVEDGNWTSADYQAEDITFHSADGTELHGWYFEHPEPRAHVLFCHGNGEHVGYLGDAMQSLCKRYRISILAFDYRGYGRSQGKPFERGVLDDGEAAQAWLAERAQIEVADVVLYGRSLGGAVAVHLASKFGTRALILERTFHSMVDIGAGQYPWLPVRWVMRNRYPSLERIANYHGPLLQLHGNVDTLVPIDSARLLFEACPSAKKTFIEAPNMGHNDLAPKVFGESVNALLESL